MIKEKTKAKQILSYCCKHASYWDCYNDEPLKHDHAKDLAMFTAKTARAESSNKKYWNKVIRIINAA